MQFKAQTYWLDTVQMPGAEKRRALPERTDVAVIGAGYTGLAAARALARRGATVTVLEGNTIGWGASSRNGGMVLTGLKLSPQALIRKYGRELTHHLYAASMDSINCVEQMVKEEEIACDFSRTGHLEVACKPAHFRAFAQSAEVIAREFNRQVRIVPRDELRQEIGSSIYHGGLVDEISAGVNPAQFVAGLARAAAKAGALLYEQTRVERIEREQKNGKAGFRVSTSRGSLWAGEIFAATSGYTGPATPALRKKIIPIGSYIIVTEILSADLAREVNPRHRMIYDSKNFLHYYRLTPDGRMLFGGRAAFFPETENTIQQSAAILRRDMVTVYPQLRDAKVEYAWGGTLDFAFDIMPHAGRVDGIYYALGYAGHGVALATYLGTKMAGTICGDREEIPFATVPFPGAPLGLYNGSPWFLPLAGLWYRFLDVIS
ncbi:MAG TPA: FAD-binding oxidoreductase [Terriglobia bacterium]|nr:FAD-binding oxidoreductase [Terriglobia bacterium]